MTRLLFYLFSVSLLFGCQDGSQTWMSYCDIDGHWEKKFNDGKKKTNRTPILRKSKINYLLGLSAYPSRVEVRSN